MYIKKTLKTDPVSKKKYLAFHLVESTRTERGPRQRVLLYMGSEINLPEGQHKLLAQRIEQIIQGVQPLLPYPEEVEQLAQTYASQVIHRLSDKKKAKEQITQETPPDFVNIDVHTIEQFEPRSVGGEHLALEMAEQLQLPKLLKSLGFSNTDTAIALGSIIGRALHPGSERETYRWLLNSSGLGELIDFDFSKTSLDKFYQISDKLLAHKDSLEAALEEIEQEFHGYKSTIALYDLTNVYIEGQAKSNVKAAHGVSKEKRNDCPLVTMGLVMNEHGFLSKTSFLSGNASEPGTLQSMIEALDNRQTLFKPTIVLDAGISTEDNLTWLRQNGYTYVVSARQDAPSIQLDGPLMPVGDAHGHVRAALTHRTEGDETWLYCESAAKAAVASSVYSNKLAIVFLS